MDSFKSVYFNILVLVFMWIVIVWLRSRGFEWIKDDHMLITGAILFAMQIRDPKRKQ